MERPLERDIWIEDADGTSVMLSEATATMTCPKCWTAQSANRAFCWQCGARFMRRPKPDEHLDAAQGE